MASSDDDMNEVPIARRGKSRARKDAPDVIALVTEFSASGELDRLKEIAIELSKPGATTKAVAMPEFDRGLAHLLELARTGSPEIRLRALAILGRLRAQARTLDKRLTVELSAEMTPLTAPATVLLDALDRSYFARVLKIVRFEGRDRYLSDFIAGEGQTKTDARSLAAVALLEGTQSLTAAFEMLGRSLRDQVHSTQDPDTSRARKLIRTLEAISGTLRQLDPPVDHEVGPAYARFITAALGAADIGDQAVRIEVCQQAFDVLLAFVRPNFSLVRDIETFDVVRVLHRLFSPARWPQETDEIRARVVKLLRETITLLAQAGVTDKRLTDLLIVVTDRQIAKLTLQSIGNDAPGISNEIRHWLETGRPPLSMDTADAMGETILESADRDIAQAFRDSLQLKSIKERVQDDLLEAGARDTKTVGETTRMLLDRIEQLDRRLHSLALGRGMEARLFVGDIVEFSPEDHEANQPLMGSRLVRVIAPQIVRKLPGRAPRIILKAQVVPNE